MQTVSSRVSSLLENTTKFDIFSEVLMDIEVNGYVDYTVNFPESVEPTLFPALEVLKTRRPAGGLPKLVTPYGSFKSTEIADLCYTKSTNWYRLPSKRSNYKYYRTKSVSEDSGSFSFSSPQEFVVEYSDEIRLNKLVVGFEYSTALPQSAEVFFYDNAWVSAGEYNIPDSGLLVLSYGESWVNQDLYSYDFTSTSKIKIVVQSMQDPGGAVEIIQVSPRISVDISDRIISVSSSKTSTESDLVSPIGTSSSNSASLEISNNDGFFDSDNQDSAVYGLIDVNVKFSIKDLVGGDGGGLEKIPSIVCYANSWNFSSEGTVSLDCSDASKFLQSRSIENSFYAEKDIRFVIADILERAEIVDYELCFTEEDVENSAKYFYFQDDETVWEALQKIALAEQAFYYFDESGRFVWISRDYWWSSGQVDYEILSRSQGDKLANMQNYSVEYTNVVNKVTVNYSPAELLKQGNRYVNNFLWEQSEPLALTAAPVASAISQNSQYLLVNANDYLFFPQEGIINVDAEYIKYSKKSRNITEDNENIESTLEDLIYDVEYAVMDAAQRLSVSQSDVEIIYIQKVVWPDTSIGCPQEFRSYSNILVDGFFIILKVAGTGGGSDILQYNASYTRKPFLCAVLQSEEEINYSYWSILSDGEEPSLGFTEGDTIFVPPNALYIEERGLFNSSPVDHYFGVDGTQFTTTYKNTPPEVVVEPERIVYDTIEDSKLKLRINTINSELIHHYSPNKPGEYDIYGAEFTFPIFIDEETIRYDGQGITGIYINKNDTLSGYYIEFTNSEYARKTISAKREVVIWKYNSSGEKNVMAGYLPEDVSLLSLDELIKVSGRPVDIFPGVPQKVSVSIDKVQKLASYVRYGEFADLAEEIEFAISDAAEKLGINQESISFSQAFKVEWSDSSLGWPQEGVFYQQVVTPGYIIVLQYEDGEDIVEVEYRGRDGGMPYREEDALVRSGGRNISTTEAQRLDLLLFEEALAAAEQDGEDIDPDPVAEVGEIADGIKITVYVNGRAILSTEDFSIDSNSIFTEGDWGVFARSNTAVDFEYIYAIDRNQDTTLLDKSKFAIRDQISGGFIDNTLEFFLDEQNELRNDFVFEDFGAWARQVVEIDTNHEIVPSAASNIFASNESSIYFIYKDQDQFSSRFAIGNRTRDIVVVSGDDPNFGSNMTIAAYGVPLNQSEVKTIKKVNDKSVWRRGEEEIIIESPWIQAEEKAQRIADWAVARWSRPSEFINVEVVVDPRVQVGDLATISIPENSITPQTHRFHVISVQKTIGDSASMSVRLRRAHF